MNSNFINFFSSGSSGTMEIRNGSQIIRMGPGGMTCIQGSNVVEMSGRGIKVSNGSQNIKMNSNGISILNKGQNSMNFSNYHNNATRGYAEQTGTTQTRYIPSETSVFETSDNADEFFSEPETEDPLDNNIYQGWDIKDNNRGRNEFQRGYQYNNPQYESESDHGDELLEEEKEGESDIHMDLPNLNINFNFSYEIPNEISLQNRGFDIENVAFDVVSDDDGSENHSIFLEADQELEPHRESCYPEVYPSFEYRKNAKNKLETCSVCRADFAESDDCRRLPCFHFFHIECIDRWVLVHRNCPLCRTKC